MSTKKHSAAIHWFRKGLRLHDNPSLLEACTTSTTVYPIFIIDPWFAKPDKVGINRYAFLLEALADLDIRYYSIDTFFSVILVTQSVQSLIQFSAIFIVWVITALFG
jgi:cryptochrome